MDTNLPLVHVEEAMGTVFSFSLEPGDLSPAAAAAGMAAACQLLHTVDRDFSTWQEASAISRLRRGALAVGDAPAAVAEVLDLCVRAGQLSGGTFDAWALPGGVDPTGLVKGWAIQSAVGLLVEAGFAGGMLNGGGDIQVFGTPQRIGIRSPDRADLLACIVDVSDAIATSGVYERGLRIIDPTSGEPAVGVLSATVVGPDLWLADALATGLFVEGLPGLQRIAAIAGYSALVIDLAGNLRPSPFFPLVPLEPVGA